MIQKIYDILKAVKYEDQDQLYKLCTSEQFPTFASQFAMYYTLTKINFPENFKEVNTTLQHIINHIVIFRMTQSNKQNVGIYSQDPRFLNQLVQAIGDLKEWKTPGKESLLRPELVYDNLPFTAEDIKQLTSLEPKKITIRKQVLSQLGNQEWLSWKRQKSRFSTLRGASHDTVIVTN